MLNKQRSAGRTWLKGFSKGLMVQIFYKKKLKIICSIFNLKIRTLKITFSVGYLRLSQSIAFCDVRPSNLIAMKYSEEPAVSSSKL